MRKLYLVSILLLSGCAGEPEKTPPFTIPAKPVEYIHPLFRTPVSTMSPIRPALQVDILDASESWFTTAELYLAVHSSRFPSSTWIVLPLNRGDFEGAAKRFVQLPFEFRESDTLVFNLLDEDSLTEEQEHLLLGGCKAAGYCLFHAGRVYRPEVARIMRPAIDASLDAVAQIIINECDLHSFDNYGTAEFIVPRSLPRVPSLANKLTLLDDSRYARIQLRVYGSDDSFTIADGS